MLNKKLVLVWMALSCLGFVACDDGDESRETPVCTENAKQCQGANLLVCHDNAWHVDQNCAKGCNAGACLGDDTKPPVDDETDDKPGDQPKDGLPACKANSQSECAKSCSSDRKMGYYWYNGELLTTNCEKYADCVVDDGFVKCSGEFKPKTEGGEVGDKCNSDKYTQTCINDGKNALVCWDGRVTQWDCEEKCNDAGYNPLVPLQVECKKKVALPCDDPVTTGGIPGVDCCVKENYLQTCSADGKHAYVCWDDHVTEWRCSSCDDAGWSVEVPLQIYCEPFEKTDCPLVAAGTTCDSCNGVCNDDKSAAYFCSNGSMMVTACADNSCSVVDGKATCGKLAACQNPVSTKGNFGDCCDHSNYKPSCDGLSGYRCSASTNQVKVMSCKNTCEVLEGDAMKPYLKADESVEQYPAGYIRCE